MHVTDSTDDINHASKSNQWADVTGLHILQMNHSSGGGCHYFEKEYNNKEYNNNFYSFFPLFTLCQTFIGLSSF